MSVLAISSQPRTPAIGAIGHTAGADGLMVAARPFLDLLSVIERRHLVLHDAAPNSEATGVYHRVRAELGAAYEAAKRTEMWVTVEQAHRLSGIPKSTLTRLCRDRAAEIGAKKIGKSWSISTQAFQRFLNSNG